MKRIKCLFVLILVLFVGVACVACNNDSPNSGEQADTIPAVDYTVDNAYEVETVDDDKSCVFAPKGVTCEYGLIFYVGTSIAPSYYTYLGEALAKQGYLVVMPKYKLNMCYNFYKATEDAYANYADVKFFLGGHSQGGGAAVKRAQENTDKTVGVVLYAPLCYSSEVIINEKTKQVPDTIADTTLPTMLIEASEDHVLTDSMKTSSRNRLPEGYTHHMIEGGCHMSFSTMDSDSVLEFFKDGPLVGITKDKQRELTVEYTLAFMKATVSATSK